MKKILLAGATGYLGQYLAKELLSRDYETVLLARNAKKLDVEWARGSQVLQAEITQPKTLTGIADGVDTIITTVGITRQKDGLTYMDVDYQGNRNLLDEALRAGVKHFIYISAINGDKMRHLKIFSAKERFVDELKASGIAYTIVRPNGFFSDMGDFLEMAKGGRVFLFGDGEYRLNPIHGADLAKVVVDAVATRPKELIVGGPDVLSQNELAALALHAWSKKRKITHLPDWIRRLTIGLMRTFTSSKTYGPFEFFLTAMAMENVAPTYGNHHLADHFKKEVNRQSN